MVSKYSLAATEFPPGHEWGQLRRPRLNILAGREMGLTIHLCIHWLHYFGMTEKNAGLRIRVEQDLRQRFVRLCRSQDRPAAQVLRDFMRRYIAEHEIASESPRSERTKGRKF